MVFFCCCCVFLLKIPIVFIMFNVDFTLRLSHIDIEQSLQSCESTVFIMIFVEMSHLLLLLGVYSV